MNKQKIKNILPTESYNENSFEQFWELLKLSNDKILGINWNEVSFDKIKRQLINLNFGLEDSKSPNHIEFNYKFTSRDVIEGSVVFVKNKMYWNFYFVFEKADNLINWIEKKYGKSLKLREEMLRESRYDWTEGDILIEAGMTKLTKCVSLGFQKWPDYTRMARKEISHDEFFKKYKSD